MEKMTNVKALAYVLANCDLPAEVAEKIEKIKASAERKNSATGERKPTAQQEANERMKQELSERMVADRLYTVSEVQKEILPEESGQRITALLTQMRKAGLVENLKEKGKSFYVVRG